MPTCTTTKRITTNLKTKITQDCQKIELYGSPTAKDLKKPQHPGRQRWGARADRMWRGGTDRWSEIGIQGRQNVGRHRQVVRVGEPGQMECGEAQTGGSGGATDYQTLTCGG